MNIFIHTLSTELLKMKRTLGFWLALVAPLVLCGLEFLIIAMQGVDMMKFANGQSWLWHMKFTLTLWGLFLLPLFVTLETALLAGWEHDNQTWKLLIHSGNSWILLNFLVTRLSVFNSCMVKVSRSSSSSQKSLSTPSP